MHNTPLCHSQMYQRDTAGRTLSGSCCYLYFFLAPAAWCIWGGYMVPYPSHMPTGPVPQHPGSLDWALSPKADLMHSRLHAYNSTQLPTHTGQSGLTHTSGSYFLLAHLQQTSSSPSNSVNFPISSFRLHLYLL